MTGAMRSVESRLVELEVIQGRPARAIARFGPRPDLSEPTWWYDVLVLSVLAEAHADPGDAKGAEAAADLALSRTRLMRNRVDGVEVLRVHAKSLSMQGRRQEATAALREALSAALEIFSKPGADKDDEQTGRMLRELGRA